jgi:hypothetical protein
MDSHVCPLSPLWESPGPRGRWKSGRGSLRRMVKAWNFIYALAASGEGPLTEREAA